MFSAFVSLSFGGIVLNNSSTDRAPIVSSACLT
jgi:hypothetical protein